MGANYPPKWWDCYHQPQTKSLPHQYLSRHELLPSKDDKPQPRLSIDSMLVITEVWPTGFVGLLLFRSLH